MTKKQRLVAFALSLILTAVLVLSIGWAVGAVGSYVRALNEELKSMESRIQKMEKRAGKTTDDSEQKAKSKNDDTAR